MQFFLKKSFVEFNSFSFGIAAAPPAFLITPSAFEVMGEGECYIASTSKMSVRLEFEMLDATLAMQLDCSGRPKQIAETLFSTAGELFLEELDEDNVPTGHHFKLDVLNVEPNMGYEDIVNCGRRLVVTFNLKDPEKGGYLTKLEV